MRILKLSLGVFLALIALILLTQAFKSSPPELYEKLAAFFISGGLAFWLLYSSRKNNK
jgi:hypothetical protein